MCSKARAGASRSSQETPFVSVVTPFYNTEEYLSECIESVLNQTHENFEYILQDNCSTDGSRAIAESYARQDDRIRLTSTDSLLSQVDNYNRALRQISGNSAYVKIIQADDTLYPHCLECMVGLAQKHPRVGLVGAPVQREDGRVAATMSSADTKVVSGVDIGRGHLKGRYFLFGTASTVLYRADLVRDRCEFFDPDAFAEDTDACYRILTTEDFGYVDDILSFMRTENDGIHNKMKIYSPEVLEGYLFPKKYGRIFFYPSEASKVIQEWRKTYYDFLGSKLLQARGLDFWSWHQTGLGSIDESIDWMEVVRGAGRRMRWAVRRPDNIVRKVIG